MRRRRRSRRTKKMKKKTDEKKKTKKARLNRQRDGRVKSGDQRNITQKPSFALGILCNSNVGE